MIQTPKKYHCHNTKFLLLQVPSPINSPSAAAMLRARSKNSTTKHPNFATRCLPPKNIPIPLEKERNARIYAIFGSPPRFDLWKGRYYDRRSRGFGRKRAMGRGVFTSTPLPGKDNLFFGAKGRRRYWNRLAKRDAQPVLRKRQR
jgi:hypothetical protein